MTDLLEMIKRAVKNSRGLCEQWRADHPKKIAPTPTCEKCGMPLICQNPVHYCSHNKNVSMDGKGIITCEQCGMDITGLFTNE